ncbi:PKS-NRPS hybrid synthetase cheA-like [Cicer arietinum]|uniref:Uncharacterized protein LOC101492922 n=1 Tax=Cicer arietinum TaxID=3827 RepID=A0A3Q7Y3E4_CICAR|nr:uncharacterized protein LOC101492922 [Cicer arietinum]
MTFCVGFAYLQSERVDNFTWALQMLKEQITGGEVEVIVTDRDLALMNVVECVFPKAVNLLCLFHVCKNVKAKCKMTVFPKKKQVQIMEAWEALVYSYDETQYYMNLANFEGICSSSSIFNDYVHDQWLIPHKERFVEAWTNRVMHFGNTTTQRVESAHWSLKRILQDSIGDICSVWETINSMIVLQHSEIITSFEKSIIQKVHRHSNRFGTKTCSTVTSNKVQQPRPSVTKLTPRPSVSKVQQPRVLIFKEWLPVEIHKFIDDIIDVGEDGNCGYRAVAALLGMGENFWAFIRQECVVELQEFMSHYEIIYGGQIFVQQLIRNKWDM